MCRWTEDLLLRQSLYRIRLLVLSLSVYRYLGVCLCLCMYVSLCVFIYLCMYVCICVCVPSLARLAPSLADGTQILASTVTGTAAPGRDGKEGGSGEEQYI